MRAVRRIALGLGIILLALIFIPVGLLATISARALPQVNGTLQVSGLTASAGPDVLDLFEERVDPANYLFKGASLPITTRTETIRIAGGADVTFTVRETGHGPIVNDADSRLKDNATLCALRWTATIGPSSGFCSTTCWCRRSPATTSAPRNPGSALWG